MTKLKVPGRRDSIRISADAGTGGFLNAVVTDRVRVEPLRSATDAPVELDLADDDIVELILEDGLRQWVSFAQLRADMGERLDRSGTGDLVLPTRLSIGSPARGAGDWAIEGLRILKVDLPGTTAKAIARHFESRLEQPGLCRWLPGEGAPAKTSDPIPTDRPVLLFIHGTASRTTASFGGLVQPSQQGILRQIRQIYGEHIHAFEHRTLSQSPIENAIELLEALPADTRLHVVSHSRGGLIGELLCRASASNRPAFDELDRKVFAKHPDGQNLAKLAALLEQKRPRVERFVRVACPAAGTTLASRRLDRYLSVLVNLVGLIPALKASPVYEFITSFLLAVVKERTDPSELPGLEAQMPESALVRILNRPDMRVDSDLCVISGDIEGGGIFQRLGILATDAYYAEDHDLVVNTRAMYGGAARTKQARFLFDRGPRVHHFSYFENERSTTAILAGLTGAAGHGLEELTEDRRELPAERFVSRSAVPLPTVFVLPGIMGTHLAVDGNRVWLDPLDIALGRMERLRVDGAPEKSGGKKTARQRTVVAERLVGSAYDDLCAFLADSHEVVPFPYDWRLSLLDEAKRLAAAVETCLDDTDLPVRIVAHSMGGLLARTMIAQRPDLWARLCDRGGRLIMLGTPNGGSWVIPRVIVGRETVLRQLAMLDLKHDSREILEIISGFPGLLELLPARADGAPDFFGDEIWTEFQGGLKDPWVRPSKKHLDGVVEFRKLIDSGPVDPKHMLYVAGAAPETPIGYEMAEGDGRLQLLFLGTARGDGRVPWSTGPLPGLRIWYMPATHGEMAAHKPSFAALLDLLESGDTARLSVVPIVTRGVARSASSGAGDTFPLPEIDPQKFPDSEDLEAAALGWEPELDAEPLARRVRVTIAHGNLAWARHPVAVGHYQGDTIVSAERALDYHLGGRLTERHRIGLYPGAIETADVLLNAENRQPAGAIVMGLGKVGRLSPGGLTATFAHACLRYAATVREARSATLPDGGEIGVSLTSLLIGTGESGLSLEDSLRSMLRAVEIANERLAGPAGTTTVRINELEILELYKDRSVQAAWILSRLMNEGAFSGFSFDESIRALPGGRSRVFHAEDPQWWRPLQIEGNPKQGEANGSIGLRFLAVADRASATVSNLASQRKLVDGMVERAIGVSRRDRELAQAMFELLVPNDLKRHTSERRNLLLLVDDKAAEYPWELIEDPMLPEPLSVSTGMIRQLITSGAGESVLSPTEDRALVVGNPLTHLDDLPAAAKEAEHVVGLLSGHGRFTVEQSIEKGADDILRKLFSRNHDGQFGYKVLHLAGHGVFQEGQDPVTGMVIGPDTYLTPGIVGQIRPMPELVFLNCCYLGKVSESAEGLADMNRLAANLGTQFIRMGVRAVIAAGWAVNDSAAATFATCFYESMLNGREFGHAVRYARSETFGRHGSLNTWGAYQCYGDPGYRLRPRESGSGGNGLRFIDPAEVVIELLNIANDASASAAYGEPRLRERLEEVTAAIPERWLKRGDVCAALGEAYGQIDDFSTAIQYLTTAARAEQASQPLRSIERLLNLEARHAVAELSAIENPTAADRKLCQDRLTSAIDRIDKLVGIAATAERLSVLGSAWKRLAVVSTGAGRSAALASAESAYRRAHELTLERTNIVDTYPLLNWLTLMAIRRWQDRWTAADGALFREQIEIAALRAAEQDRESPSFFNAISVGECVLVRQLGEGELDARSGEVVDQYVRAWKRGASRREFGSARDNFSTLVVLLEDHGGRQSKSAKVKTREGLRMALDRIRGQLEAAAAVGSDR